MIGVRDLSIRRPSPVAFPRAGERFVDPDFGSTVLRVTDERDGVRCNHAYSYWPALNCDSTRLLIAIDDVPTLYRFDPAGCVLAKEGPLVEEPTGSLQFEGATWSSTLPDVLYALSRERPALYRVNVARVPYQRCTLLADFADRFPAGARLKHLTTSRGGTVFSFLAVVPGAPAEAVVWTKADDQLWTFTRGADDNINEAQINKLANRVVVHMEDGRAVLWSFRRIDADNEELPNATGHWDNGSTLMANGDGQGTGVQVRSYTAPDQPRNILRYRRSPGGALNWRIAEHVSLRGDDESQLLLSTYGGDRTWAPFEDELVMVRTDGSGFLRLAHTFSSEAQTNRALKYFSQPRAVLSQDGRWAVWTSDLGSSSRLDVLMLRVPA